MSELAIPERLSEEDFARLPSHEREHYLKTIVKKTINMNPNGITASQLSKRLGIDPRTLDKHLSVMLHTGDIYSVMFDQTTVFLPNGRALHAVLEKEFANDKDTVIQVFQLHNRLGDFVYLQEKKNSDYREDTNMGVMIPLEKFPDFVEYLKDARTEMMRRT